MKKICCFFMSLLLCVLCFSGCEANLPTKPVVTPEASSLPAEMTKENGTDPADTTAAVPQESSVPVTEEATQVPSAEETTETPTTPAPEVLSAAEVYENAVAQLPKDYHLEMNLVISRSMDREQFITTDEWVMDVKSAGTEEMTAAVILTQYEENRNGIFDTIVYQFYFSQGKTVLLRQGICFEAEQSAEDFLRIFPPLALLHADKYESIEWTDDSRSSIGFDEAVDTEWEWLGMDCSDITEVQGLAGLDADGRLAAFEYDAEYALEGISFTAEAEAVISYSPSEPAAPAYDPAGVIPTDQPGSIPILDRASCFLGMNNLSASYLSLVLSYAAGVSVLKQEVMALDEDEQGRMLYDQLYRTVEGSTSASNEMELRHFAGKTSYTVDKVETETDSTAEELAESMLTYIEDRWFTPEDMSQIRMRDENDCWLIKFTLNEEASEWVRNVAETELFGEADYLENLGAVYQPKACTGYVSIDKGSSMPIHSKINFDANHTYMRQNLPLQYEGEWSYRAAHPDVWKMITDELRPSEKPEEPATPLFYQVTAPDGHQLWLLGTVHVGDERSAHLPQEIYDALQSSDALAVEIDITNFEDRLEEDDELMEAYRQATFYSDQSTVFDHLEEETAEKLKTAIQKYGGDIQANWLAYNVASFSTLIEQQTLELGRLESYDRGVDTQLIKLAKDNGIEVWDVEDYAEHISLLGNFSEELQELMLQETLDTGRYASNLGADELFDAWCRGDEAELSGELASEEAQEDEELTPEEQALIDEYNEGMMRKRNAEMVEKAKEYLAGDKTVFFAVGLAHLLDEEGGLLKCLREEGYTVEQVGFAP